MNNLFAAYTGNHIGKEPVAPVSDEEVNNELQNMLKEAVSTEKKDGLSENGDIVNIDFEGFLDGVAFEGGKGEKYDLELGSHSFIPGFEEQLIGHKAEEDVDVNVTFPENYQAAHLAGKPVVFKCKVHEVKRKVKPELNDAFAAQYGMPSLEEMKKKLRSNLEKNHQAQADGDYLEKLIREIVSKSTIEVSDDAIAEAKKKILDYYTTSVAQYGMTLDSYIAAVGMDKAKFDASIAEEAKNTAKTDILTDYIANKENLNATEAEINQEIQMIQAYYHLDDEKVNQLVASKRDQIIKDIVREKLAHFLLSKND